MITPCTLRCVKPEHISHTNGKFHLSQAAGLDEATAISLYCCREWKKKHSDPKLKVALQQFNRTPQQS